MPAASITVLPIVAAILAVLFMALMMRREPASARSTRERAVELELELARLRQDKAELELRLAVEAQKLRRIPELEGTLDAISAQLEIQRGHAAFAGKELAAREQAIIQQAAAEAELRRRLQQASDAHEAARTEAGALAARHATLQETLEQERRAGSEKLALLLETRDSMTKEFRLLSEEVMSRHGETFGKQNREQIDTILGPLREKLAEFQQGLQAAHTDSTKERAALREHIDNLSDFSAKMTAETTNLTRALKGRTQTQGAWGEMILATILEKSGLRAGEEYVAQKSHVTDDGQRLRPDVVVSLPGGQRIVIDSKVSLVAFEAHVNAEAEADRAMHLTAHLDSMRRHIRGLGEKEYHAVTGSSLDYVILFVPIEGALAAALGADPELTGYATKNNVAIATPTTLMIALRTVANVWNIEKRHRNADDIASRAGLIYDKFVGFAEDMTTLGGRLTQARDCYDKALGKLSTGKGNVVRQLEDLKRLGASTGKSIPAALLDETDAVRADATSLAAD